MVDENGEDELKIRVPKFKKLIANLFDKKKYIVHYRTLKLYLAIGCKLLKVHRILRFRQEPWLREFIAHTTQLRADSSFEFEQDQYKLTNNSLYG